jgi:hypothetical protein
MAPRTLRGIHVLVAAAVLAAPAAAGCGADDDAAAPANQAERAERAEADAAAAAGEDPVGEPGTREVVGGQDSPLLEPAHLVAVGAAPYQASADAAFDRVVLELEADAPPTWRVGYVRAPIVEAPTGLELEVEGRAFLELRLEPATAVDLTGEDPRETYPGPDRIAVDGRVVTEFLQVADHHGRLAWVLGLRHRAPFAAAFLPDPPRLVVDVVDDRD